MTELARDAPDWLVRMVHVPGWLDAEEAMLLNSLTARLHRRGRCVELGAYQGRSALALAAALTAPDRMLSIDTFAGSPEHQPGEAYFDPATMTPEGKVGTLDLFRRNLVDSGLDDRVEIWVMRTDEAAKRFSGTVSLLFVDADHAYGAVCADVDVWRPHVGPEGVIVLHDVGTWEGPTRCAADLLADGFTRVAQAGTALALQAPRGWGGKDG